ncbi:C-type lectin domain family 10 member A-like [Micropterus dolomieu]|uniref:C-type lectin domain family 10 member A-like n=1 Tax=Micropterus dolomieu TaxID=147949 RepID=UPI001E8D697E|nr:C-type lectin domain family 10 member A-like [Micropterus dolomieu]
MEEIYVNVEYDKSVDSKPSQNQTGPRSSQRRFQGAVLSLGLLSVFLLAGLIYLGVHYHYSAAKLSTIKDKLTERLQTSNTKLSSLMEEKDLLNDSLVEMTKELERLQGLSKRKKTCPEGWRISCGTCYLRSDKSGSWDKGREDCKGKGGDLVVIDSTEEQLL